MSTRTAIREAARLLVVVVSLPVFLVRGAWAGLLGGFNEWRCRLLRPSAITYTLRVTNGHGADNTYPIRHMDATTATIMARWDKEPDAGSSFSITEAP